MRCAGVLLIVLVSVAACRDAPAGITVGNGDTVVINARRAVTLPVRDVIDDRQVQYEVTSGTVLRALGGDSLACSGRGDARLRMTAGSVSSSVVVLCRPIKAVSNVRVVELIAGGPPQPLAIGGVDDSGRTVGRIAVDVTVRDSSIAVVREGLIYPRRPGWTFLLFDLAGCQVQSLVRVHDPAPAADTLPRPARFPKIDRRKMCAEVPPWGYPW